jgi:hypothetical protein
MKTFLELKYDIWSSFGYCDFVQSSTDFELKFKFSFGL